MTKYVSALLMTGVAICALTVSGSSANAQLAPVKPTQYVLVPTLDCSATVNGTAGTAHVTKTNAGTIDKTKDVIALIQTPTAKIWATTCGSAFTSEAVGTSVNLPFPNPPTTDKSFIYTCTAHQLTTSLACTPPR